MWERDVGVAAARLCTDGTGPAAACRRSSCTDAGAQLAGCSLPLYGHQGGRPGIPLYDKRVTPARTRVTDGKIWKWNLFTIYLQKRIDLFIICPGTNPPGPRFCHGITPIFDKRKRTITRPRIYSFLNTQELSRNGNHNHTRILLCEWWNNCNCHAISTQSVTCYHIVGR